MVFYSLGSALGAAATTALYATTGWTGPVILGAAFAACGYIVWALSFRTAKLAIRPDHLGRAALPR